MIITIGRECGCGGHEIGRLLAEHYGWKLYDKKILVERARKQGLYDAMEYFFEEKPVDSMLYSIAMYSGDNRSKEATFKRLRSLITEESFVLIGRCGNFVYRNADTDVVSIFLHAGRELRIQRTMQKQGTDGKKAAALIDRIDEKRARFHQYYTEETWGDARTYQIALDRSRLQDEQVAALLISYIDQYRGT